MSYPQGAIQLFVRVVDIVDGSNRRQLVDHFRLRESLTPLTTTPFKKYLGFEHNTTIVARFHLICTENFYQPNCSVFCVSQDDGRLGHYECAPETGVKVCLPGHADPSTNCTECATATGCCELYCKLELCHICTHNLIILRG